MGEKGHIGKTIGPFLRKRMAEEKVCCRIEEVTPVANRCNVRNRTYGNEEGADPGNLASGRKKPWTSY